MDTYAPIPVGFLHDACTPPSSLGGYIYLYGWRSYNCADMLLGLTTNQN